MADTTTETIDLPSLVRAAIAQYGPELAITAERYEAQVRAWAEVDERGRSHAIGVLALATLLVGVTTRDDVARLTAAVDGLVSQVGELRELVTLRAEVDTGALETLARIEADLGDVQAVQNARARRAAAAAALVAAAETKPAQGSSEPAAEVS